MSKADELLQKVYDRLDAIDLDNLSLKELPDFVEVVQRCKFCEQFCSYSPCSLQ